MATVRMRPARPAIPVLVYVLALASQLVLALQPTVVRQLPSSPRVAEPASPGAAAPLAEVATLERLLAERFPGLSQLLEPGAAFVAATYEAADRPTRGYEALAGEGGATLRVALPARYDGPTVARYGELAVTLRPLGARPAAGGIAGGRLVYPGAYPSVDSVFIARATGSKELLVLRDARAPRRFVYELGPLPAGIAVGVEGGDVVFRTPGDDRALTIEAPWLMAAGGERRYDLARWELGAPGPGGRRRLTLRLTTEGLAFPIVLDPSWRVVKRMPTARSHHTATRLPNGHVLVVGGSDALSALASTVTYNPAVDGWSVGPMLDVPRWGHTATLLPDGRVLIVGGYNERNGFLRSAELYAGGALQRAADMPAEVEARIEHTATLLPDGRVLIAGGRNGVTILESAAIYDPASNSWQTLPPMPVPRYLHSANALPDGNVLVAGGRMVVYPEDNPGDPIAPTGVLSYSHTFDLAAQSWVTGTLSTERSFFSSVELCDGSILAVGGDNIYVVDGETPARGDYLKSSEIYSPTLGSWVATSVAPMSYTSNGALLARLPSCEVLAIGNSAMEIYNPASNSWRVGEPLNTPRSTATGTLLDDGSFLVAGGISIGGGGPLSSVERYWVGAGSWQPSGRMNDPRTYHSTTVLLDGTVLAVGGIRNSGNTPLNTAEIFDPASGAWRRTGTLRRPKAFPAAARLIDGRVLVVDGPLAEIYDPATEQWSAVATSASEVQANLKRAFRLPDGDVLIVGLSGEQHVERFDHTAGAFLNVATDDLPAYRYNQTFAQLADGRVLMFGGQDSDARPLKSALILDPARPEKGWQAAPDLPLATISGNAALLPDGRLLVVAGAGLNEYGGNYPTQIFTPSRSGDAGYPAGGSWEVLGTFQTYYRDTPSALTTLPDGSVLATSNVNQGVETVPTERFDPASETWGYGGTLPRGYIGHTATALPDGSVLVSGGYGADYASSNESFIYRLPEGRVGAAPPTAAAYGQSMSATLLPSGRTLLIGPADASGPAAELYSPSGGITPVEPPGRRRLHHSATLLADGRVLVAGGSDLATGAQLDHAEIYSEATGWRELPPMPGGVRLLHTATLLRDGRVLVAGGLVNGGSSDTALIFDPGNLDAPWQLLDARLVTARNGHSAVLLNDGTVLISGGGTSSTEIFDPASAASPFQARGESPFVQVDQSTVLMRDGRVLAVGSNGRAIYDPARGSWSVPAAMPFNRGRASLTLLPDGRVLLAGGQLTVPLSELSLYDPVSNIWQDAGALATARFAHKAVLLADGRILFIGGLHGTGTPVALRSVESYSLGEGVPDSRSPVVDAVASTGASTGDPPRVSAGAGLRITGRRLAGGDWAAPGVQTIVRLRSLANESTHVLAVQPGTLSDTALTTLPLPAAIPPGPAMLEVLVNGVASAPRPLQVNAPPRLLASAGSQVVAPNSEVNLTLTVSDAETPAEDLRLEPSSSNQALLDPAGITIVGTGRERLLTLRPRRDQTGVADVRLPLSDGLNTTTLTLRLDISGDEAARWRPVAPMGAPRAGHSLHLLPGGEILAVGGAGGDGSVTELYMPATGSWHVTGAPASALPGRALSLADGRVFRVTDGAAEVYSSEDGRWQSVAAADHPALAGGGRGCAALALLRDGRVLLAGGAGGAGGATESAWLYDPVGESWIATGSPLREPRACASAVTLSDGRVLIVGGTYRDRGLTRSLATSELFDPGAGGGAGAFTPAGPLAAARVSHSATLLPDGRVLVVGGLDHGESGTSSVAEVELYNPAAPAGTSRWSTLSFTTPPEPLPARAEHSATLLPDGSVLIAGGAEPGGAPSTSAYVVEPANTSWRSAGALGTPRRIHAAMLLADGRALVAGGLSSATTESSAELYDPATPSWREVPGVSLAAAAPVALLLPDGRVFVADGASRAVVVLDPATGARQSLADLPTPRARFTATLVAGGRVVVAGGESAGQPLAEALLYDPGSPAAPRTIPLVAARARHTATLLRDGRVLLVGGGSGAAGSGLQSAELVDPALATAQPAGVALGAPLQNHSATLLPDGHVLVAGGGPDTPGQGSASAAALLYDPDAGTWRRAGDLGFARGRHTATLLPGGEVLVAGGYSTGRMATTAEVYSPTAGGWRTVASPAQARGRHSATLLPDGSVLLAGGANDAGAAFARAERYEAASNRWLGAGSLAEARYDHAAVALADGTLLVLGGASGSGLREQAERFELSLGVAAARRPVISAAMPLDATGALPIGGRLRLEGAGFTGSTLGSAPGGLPGSLPVARLRSLATGQERALALDPAYPLGDAALTTRPLPADFPPGYALVSVSVGGVTSLAHIVYVNAPPRIGALTDQRAPMRRDAGAPPLELDITIGDAETPLEQLRVSARADNDALVPRVEVLPGATPATRTLRITTPLEAWGQARVTVRVEDGLSTSERSFGLEVPRDAPPWLVLLYLAGDDIPTTFTAAPGDDGAAPPDENDTLVRGVRTDSLTTHINRLVERLADSEQLPHNSAMRLVVLYDGNTRGDSKLLVREPNAEGSASALVDVTCRPRPDGTCDLIRPWPTYPLSRELDTGSTDTLRTFVSWARQTYPGSPYTMLSIVDHGGGWAPDGGTVSQPRAGKTWQLGAWRGLNLDYASNSALSTKELGTALRGLAPFDVLFVDACLMGMVEVAHEVAATPSSTAGRPVADYLVAGENLLWARLPYQNYLHPANLTATTTPRQLATSIVKLYNKADLTSPDIPDPLVPSRVEASENIEPFTIAALDLRAALALTPRIERLAAELLAALPGSPSVGAAVRAAHREAQKFDYDLSLSLEANDGYVDLADFADRLALQPAIGRQARQVASEISASIKQTVVMQSRYRNGRIVLPSGTRVWNFDRAYGLAIYAPLGEQDCRTTGPILAAPPSAEQRQHYVAVPGAAPGSPSYILVERQLGYYRDPQQLAFSAAAPSWAALLEQLDGQAPARNPDPDEDDGRPYGPPTQVEPGGRYYHRPGRGPCMRVPTLDFDLAHCLPASLVASVEWLIHTDIPTATLGVPASDIPLYGWSLLGIDAEGAAVPQPQPRVAGTISFTFTAAFLADPDISLERLVVIGWDGRRWVTLPALPPSDAEARLLVVPLQRFDRYALVSRLGAPGLDNLTAQPQDLLVEPAALRAGAPSTLALTVRRPSGKVPLEDVRVRFAYQYPGEARRTIGETTIPLLSPLSEADSLPLAWTPPMSGEVTLIATIDPYLEQRDDDPRDNEVSLTLPVAAPEVDAAAPRVAAFSVAGGAQTTTARAVPLAISAEDPAPSSGIEAMRLIEYRLSAATGRWRYVQDSGWIPYARASAWELDAAPGAAYLQAWVRDGAGRVSTYPYRALINLLPASAGVAEGGVHLYRFALSAGQCLAASVSSAAGDADLYVWGPSAMGGAPSRWVSDGRGGADTLLVGAAVGGTYQLEVVGFSAATYTLIVEPRATGAPGCPAAPGEAATLPTLAGGPAKPARGAPLVPLDLLPDEGLPADGVTVIYLPLVRR